MGKHRAVNQPSARPTAKVLATWLTGSGATLATAVLVAVSENVDQNALWGVLAASLATGAAGYLKRSNADDV